MGMGVGARGDDDAEHVRARRDPMLTFFGERAAAELGRTPWTNVYGLGRSLLAAGTLATLAASPSETLFRPAAGLPTAPICESVVRFSVFCVLPRPFLGLAQAVAVAVLVVIASGWRPRLTALPHWWISWSVAASITLPDGGDQVAVVLSLLLLPVALTDPRVWHWSAPAPVSATRAGQTVAVIALSALAVARLQVAGIYVHSSLAKLGVEEWRDGTAMYYWLQQPGFAPTPLLREPLLALAQTPFGAAVMTWGPIALELALALSLLMAVRARRTLLVLGISFHLAIAAMMGLVSFALSMVAALILLLRPRDDTFRVPRAWWPAFEGWRLRREETAGARWSRSSIAGR
jgi:sporulation delaying protein B